MKSVEQFLEHSGVNLPIICGAMYPTSNPELVAAVSEAGGLGIIQPVALQYAHKLPVENGLKYLRSLTQKPLGFNLLVESSSKRYEERMQRWVDLALAEGIRFFITALGNPTWVLERVHDKGGIVYHNVTSRRWAEKALGYGVDGLIAVNDEAGGHAGTESPEEMFKNLEDLGYPVLSAGGVGGVEGFKGRLEMGYGAVQMGTRFIATQECTAHQDYKQAILKATPEEIVLTDLLSGVPAAVILTPFLKRSGWKAGPIARRLLRHPRFKRWVRGFYAIRAGMSLRKSSFRPLGYKDFLQAGRSVGEIDAIENVPELMAGFALAFEELKAAQS